MKLVYACLLLLLCHASWAQSEETSANPKNAPAPGGSPYLLKDWADGIVRYNNGRVMDQFKLKFDCSTNRLLMQFEGAAFPADGNNVKEFVLYTRSGKKRDSMVFRKGFPPIDRGNTETFYQVLVSGKATLLHLFTKNVIDQKELLASNNRRFYQEENTYYLLEDGTMLKLPENRDELIQQLPAKAAPLKDFIASAQLKMKGTEDFVKITEKYNELLATEQKHQ